MQGDTGVTTLIAGYHLIAITKRESMATGIKQDMMNMWVLIHLQEAFLTLEATKSYLKLFVSFFENVFKSKNFD